MESPSREIFRPAPHLAARYDALADLIGSAPGEFEARVRLNGSNDVKAIRRGHDLDCLARDDALTRDGQDEIVLARLRRCLPGKWVAGAAATPDDTV